MLRNTLKTFIPISILWIIIAGIIVKFKNETELDMYSNIEKSIVEIGTEEILDDVGFAINDLRFLSSLSGFEVLFDDTTNPVACQAIARDFLNMSIHNELYDQIRFIDKSGMERIRINSNNGKPALVPKTKLQNKKDRYYFKDAIVLDKNEIYISPFDLNIENGQIEQPFKPMIRLATPVFNNYGQKQGLVVLNYKGGHILNHLTGQKNQVIKNDIMLLNSTGYWLKGQKEEQEWGFMFEDRKNINFASQFPAEWEKIKNKDKIQFETKNGLFTSKTVYPVKEEIKSSTDNSDTNEHDNNLCGTEAYYWKVVSFIPHNLIYMQQKKRLQITILALAIFLSIMFIVLWRVSIYRHLRKQALIALEESEKKYRQQSIVLAESNATKDKFFSIIAHDLKNAFNGLLGFSHEMNQNISRYSTEDIQKFASFINTSAQLAYTLLKNLLEWARIQMGEILPEPVKISPEEIINEVTPLYTSNAKSKNIDLQVSIDCNETVAADKDMIKTVLRNLISNAIKFTHPEGIVKVETRQNEAGVLFMVKDTGTGIDPKYTEKLFRIDSKLTKTGTDGEQGTGLGLILCKEFIDKNKGKIWVESTVGKGSTFCFVLPYA